MANNSPSSALSNQPAIPANEYQKQQHHQQQYHHYGGYPPQPAVADGSHHPGYHHHHYAGPPSHYPPPPPLPHGHQHGGVPPPSYHPPSSYHYPAPPPLEDNSSRRDNGSPRVTAKSNIMHPSLVTPKSLDDSDTGVPPALPPIEQKSSKKKTTSKRGAKTRKESSSGSRLHASSNKEFVVEEEEELTVAPMRQDFHFYAMDHYEQVKEVCKNQLATASTSSQKNKENELFLLTTLINEHLIKNWEAAPSSVRSEYLKKEEADRKRFMGEEEVASRHCATLTARRRSPKQAEPRAGYVGTGFGVPSLLEPSNAMGKRASSDMNDSLPKRAKTAV